jgi:hypothetical protein
MTIFSAAMLVKCSAKQLKFYHNKNLEKGKDLTFPPEGSFVKNTEAIQAGADFQAKNSISDYIEMQGVFSLKSHPLVADIYFCHDEIRIRNKNFLDFIEYKSTNYEVQDSYFRSSLIQTALYQELTNRVNFYKTASFIERDKHVLNIKQYDKRRSILHFGDNRFAVRVKGNKKILGFYVMKAKSILQGWEHAEEFDYRYKGKEWDLLRQYITYRKVR